MFTTVSIIILVSVLFVLKELLRSKNKKNSKRSSWGPPLREQTIQKPSPNIRDKGDQLKIVSSESVEFSTRKLMGFHEYKVFNLIEKEIIPDFKYCRVFAQVSLGEILDSSYNLARRCINSKRVDILIIDGSGNPLLAVEYQGSGHYKSDAALRDAVKKEALRKAGVGYIEVTPEHTNDDIKYIVRRSLEGRVVVKNNTEQKPVEQFSV
ncbi:DUF2726 domain-containing protein [Entomomonas sp. E2T0]|uniref:DUF2726 domain-containing protein n=1 Tax=Entomomonas sp. E2T0 TaxID=2930213 RepID=UPI00222844A9|nr:DUF2726 domain-containing protein [Entomomonas sp. E2T0]UYZ83684.1 DUF2726 domain-containing protein [Entomomonas sp. E2T0]